MQLRRESCRTSGKSVPSDDWKLTRFFWGGCRFNCSAFPQNRTLAPKTDESQFSSTFAKLWFVFVSEIVSKPAVNVVAGADADLG